MDDEGVAEDVAQEPKAGNDGRVAEIVRSNIDDRHGKGVAPLCALEVHGTRERVNKIEVDRSQVLGGRRKGQIGIERVAGLKDEKLILLYRGRRLDIGVIAIEAVRIVFAMLSGLSNDDGSRTLYIARIGQ